MHGGLNRSAALRTISYRAVHDDGALLPETLLPGRYPGVLCPVQSVSIHRCLGQPLLLFSGHPALWRRTLRDIAGEADMDIPTALSCIGNSIVLPVRVLGPSRPLRTTSHFRRVLPRDVDVFSRRVPVYTVQSVCLSYELHLSPPSATILRALSTSTRTESAP